MNNIASQNVRTSFIHRAVQTVPSEHQAYANDAAEWVAEQIGTGNSCMGYVSLLAATFHERAAQPRDGAQPNPLAANRVVDLAHSLEEAELVRPWAEEARLEIWGDRSPPFPQDSDAICWLKEQARTFKPVGDWPRKAQEFMDEVSRRINQMQAVGLPLSGSLAFDLPMLDYVEGDEVRFVPAFGPKLQPLANMVGRLSNATGWHNHEALMFILVDRPPLLPAIRASRQLRRTKLSDNRGTLVRDILTIEVHDPKVDLAPLLSRLSGQKKRRQAGSSRKEAHARAYLFVHAHRRESPKAKWKDILAAWNAENPGDAYKSIRGLQKAESAFRRKKGGSQ